jgi:rubredoxin
LGIYRRDNAYPLDFLEAVCALCLESNIGKICLTTWNTLIIKGISEQNKQRWEKLLGSSGINMRHSSLELNWQLPDFNKTALRLKRYLVNLFDRYDIQTYGLGFTIKTEPMEAVGSIVIERKGRLNLGKLSLLPIYTILYAENFSPNSQEYHVYAVDIGKRELPAHLMQLCRNYYQQLGKVETKVVNVKKDLARSISSEVVYQCTDCLTIYLEKYGDEMNDIPPHTPFAKLPESYCCPVCENPKSRYKERSLSNVA